MKYRLVNHLRIINVEQTEYRAEPCTLFIDKIENDTSIKLSNRRIRHPIIHHHSKI